MITETAPAKINLALHVTGRRADGYHLLDLLAAFADLADPVTLPPGPLLLASNGPFGTDLARDAAPATAPAGPKSPPVTTPAPAPVQP